MKKIRLNKKLIVLVVMIIDILPLLFSHDATFSVFFFLVFALPIICTKEITVGILEKRGK